ncbi:alpha/beta fold hydrolase [Roseospirillum parvum]|uniref:Pimeloyl-ACP methyl ester carboxylesterase n=1 Tax=Roseospirillum parvum TaxID=83401 RepID=A0A1G7V3B9_9PROT|nr:alpha/beta hydrolase [Roseospirillum parvum]SDG54312.1 Pimeloyl-ACP methyl ester carboxylesterase [Roseospirillum parvum]
MLTLDQRFDHQGQTVAWGHLGDGPPLVLVHGFPWSAQAWRRIAPWLARHHSVYFFDLLGCGQSHMAEGQNVAPQVQNDLLAALIAHWGLARPHVVGHDFGGLAALRGHFINGLSYGRLTLFDAVAVLPSGSPFFAHVRRHQEAFAGLPAYAHKALLEAYMQAAAHRPLGDEARDLYAAPWIGEVGQAAFYRQIAHANSAAIAELEPLYRRLDCPLRLVWGAHDTFIPPAQGAQLARHLGLDPVLDTIISVPEAGHLILEDAPEAVVAALLAV